MQWSVRNLQRGGALVCVAVAVLIGGVLFVDGRWGAGFWLDGLFLISILTATVIFSRMLATGAIGSVERYLQRGRVRERSEDRGGGGRRFRDR